MSFWVLGGSRHDANVDVTYAESSKRRVAYDDEHHEPSFYHISKRPRVEPWGHDARYGREYAPDDTYGLRDSVPIRDLAFLVIREGSPSPDPPATRRFCPMERTRSGLSISSDTSQHCSLEEEEDFMLDDLAAANLVKKHVASFRRRYPDSKHGRILKALINPKSREADFTLDNDALRSIFIAANEIFFANRLAQRVTWDWSHAASEQYQSHIVGTTALRRSAQLGGYETLIVLSSPILKDTKYNRRLLISTFLHEMIHSFLFVTCGIKARHSGGHTDGFRMIAEMIDDWVGAEHLHLRYMEADLERFRSEPSPPRETHADATSSFHRHWEADDSIEELQRTRYAAHEDQRWQWYEQEQFVAPAGHPPLPAYGSRYD
jgi:hypothetical protein